MATQLAQRDERPANPLSVLRSQLEQRAAEFRMVLPSHISPDKLQRTILTAVQANPDLLSCDRRSFLTAAFKAAQDGLLPDGREAALVQFNTRMKIDGQWQTVKLAQYMPMVFGLRKKILQSGEITDIFASVVYRQEIEAGRFIYEEGTERMLRHKPLLDPDFDPSDEDIALVYSVATFKDGSKSFEVMRRSEINKVREASQTGATLDRGGNPREPKGPWVDWFAEMAKKTVIRRHSKSLPMSGDIFADVEAEEMEIASRSAVGLLASQEGGSPTPIADHTDEPLPPHDVATGEIHEDPPAADAEASEGPAKEAKPKAPRAKAERQAPPKEEPEGNGDAASTASAESASAESPSDGQAASDEDELSPAEKAAQSWIDSFKRTENVIDLKRLYGQSEMDRAAFNDDLREAVEKAYDDNLRRLGGAS